ncbi:hypothetical protein OUZ56_015517 [Daphnia magna]|uniref:Sulfotransferase domain-containing protein n=1 Tax=Daphnia magna TaxID=35525 RepID=A0ABR0AN25_9CRUS|nr:hypothetical protein OUZ56_015517 [Daphnia magna]
MGKQFVLESSNRLKKFNQLFAGYKTGLVKSEPGKFVMTTLYAKHAEILYRMEPRADDIWLLTFPKCGTTWTSELLWLLMNDCDTEKAKTTQLMSRTPFIEVPFLTPATELSPEAMQMLKSFEKMPSPRIFKSHLPFYLLHPKLLDTSKVVYVARNAKDAIVSFYHHHKLVKLHDFQGNLEEFADYFMEDEVLYAPFFPHILDAWSKRNHPNMHFMFFEDMKKDLKGEISKVATFLNQSPTDEQLDKITEHLRFDNFQQNEAVNNEAGKKMGWLNPDGRFIRKGKTGDWKNHFSPELNSRIDQWIEKNLARSDLKFVSELEQQD